MQQPVSSRASAAIFPEPGQRPSHAATRQQGHRVLRLPHVDTAVQAPTDEALMQAYAEGDGDAFAELYARHRSRLFHYLLGQLRDRSLAEELFQDVWQRLIHARSGWKPEAAFATWLFRIAHNRLNDHWRAARHRPSAPDDADERTARLADACTPELLADERDERLRLRRAMAELPQEQQEVLILRLEQELSLEEIGQITGVGRETVKSRLRYAMDKLRARLSE